MHWHRLFSASHNPEHRGTGSPVCCAAVVDRQLYGRCCLPMFQAAFLSGAEWPVHSARIGADITTVAPDHQPAPEVHCQSLHRLAEHEPDARAIVPASARPADLSARRPADRVVCRVAEPMPGPDPQDNRPGPGRHVRVRSGDCKGQRPAATKGMQVRWSRSAARESVPPQHPASAASLPAPTGQAP